MTTRKPAWSDSENAALVSLYFAMLDNAIAGKPYNKAALIREARHEHAHPATRQQPTLGNRSRGSIEAKLMNASAAHRDIVGSITATMDGHGYRCLSNYQATLRDAMAEALRQRAAEQHRAAFPHTFANEA